MGRVRRALGASATLLVLVFVCTGSAAAQAVKGGLLGNITDQGGLAVPGATVTITETSANISYNTTITNR